MSIIAMEETLFPVKEVPAFTPHPNNINTNVPIASANNSFIF